MKFDDIHNVYFLGIGGIGMSALARWFSHKGCRVAGYDRVRTPLCKELEGEGMNIHYEESVARIPLEIKHNDHALVIYTPAIPSTHAELVFLREKQAPLYKRSVVLGWITQKYFAIAVAGTHGKTTTASMVAHILQSAGKNCLAFIGGITVNTQSNIVINKSEEDVIAVVEADEFDRSFLQLSPNISIITAVDADHLDVYETEDDLVDSFRLFASRIKDTGQLILSSKAQNKMQLVPKDNIFEYNLSDAPVHAESISVSGNKFKFNFANITGQIRDLELSVPGYHNVMNCLAAIEACRLVGVDSTAIRAAVESYKGVKRRFEFVFVSPTVIFIDDYAHHPEEIIALLTAVRKLYPGKKITTVFQPHLYSRTRDFLTGFAQSLSMSDKVILLPIYPAREEPIPGISSEVILREIATEEKQLLTKESLLEKLHEEVPEVILTVGAGDIDQLVQPIAELLKEVKS